MERIYSNYQELERCEVYKDLQVVVDTANEKEQRAAKLPKDVDLLIRMIPY